ncbi:urea transporter [Staphylococcus sp. SS35]|nr:urea transporter [Staphylococcus singaporensis]
MKMIDVLLKNISQVVLLNNKWTGLFILIGLFVADWTVGLAAIIGSLIAYVFARYINYSKEEINDGLAGFNPVLTAVALTIFLEKSILDIVITIIATLLTLPVAAAVREVLRPYKVPMLTMPFVIVTWFTILLSGQVKYVETPLKLIPENIKDIKFNHNSDQIYFVQSLFEGFSQVFVEASVLGGIFILVGILIASRKAALLAIVASLLSFIIVALLGGNYDDINQGLFGYNFVLMAIALGYTFKTAINPYIATFLGVLLTVVVQLGTATLLEPFGLPALTLPFIIATWILLFAGIRQEREDIAK